MINHEILQLTFSTSTKISFIYLFINVSNINSPTFNLLLLKSIMHSSHPVSQFQLILSFTLIKYMLIAADGTSTIASSKPKWKSSLLLPLFLEDGVEERKNNDKCLAYTDSNSEAEYFSELMMKVCTLVEKDIRESDCTLKTENFEAICLEFEHKIFDHLLYEVVNEIVELSC